MGDLWHEKSVKRTRRDRRCQWCSEMILKGEPSVVVACVWEGDFTHSRYHPECSEAITRYYQTYRCWGEEMPSCAMNRGGIREKGRAEKPANPEENHDLQST